MTAPRPLLATLSSALTFCLRGERPTDTTRVVVLLKNQSPRLSMTLHLAPAEVAALVTCVREEGANVAEIAALRAEIKRLERELRTAESNEKHAQVENSRAWEQMRWLKAKEKDLDALKRQAQDYVRQLEGMVRVRAPDAVAALTDAHARAARLQRTVRDLLGPTVRVLGESMVDIPRVAKRLSEIEHDLAGDAAHVETVLAKVLSPA